MKHGNIFTILKCIMKTALTALAIAGAVMLLVVIGSGIDILSTYNEEAKEIVENSSDKSFRAQETSFIYDKNDKQIAKLKLDKDTQYLEYGDIPDDVVNAFVSVEDRNFWSHGGVDLKGLLRVGIQFLKTEGEEVHGASTITQQLTRNVFLTQEVTIERKLKEMFVATALEKKYSKQQIMEYYINSIYYANGYYGIEAAAKGYFNKSTSELSLSQIALLCGIPNSPNSYDPRKNLDRALLRRNKIIKDMCEEGYISNKEKEEALNEKITIEEPKALVESGYESFAINCAVRYLMETSGFTFRYDFEDAKDFELYNETYSQAYDFAKYKLLTGGYKIYTTLDPEIQGILQDSVDSTLSFNQNLTADNIYDLQGAATCIDNETGKVVAIVGQRTAVGVAVSSSLNRAFQSNRQPGSTIKPLIVYTPALERNYTPSTMVNDSPIEGGPKNSGGYSGRITLRSAVEQSKNVVAWQLFNEIGPKTGLSYAQQMKFSKIVPDDYYLSASLGGLTYGVNSLEMCSAYATLVNNGVYRNATCIRSILKNGKEVYTDEEPKQVYTQKAAQEMIDILQGVFVNGTARSVHWDNEKMPAAGKTGTTNDNKDGWFCGVTSYYSLTVWVGFDTPKTLNGLWGSTYPAAIWKNTMSQIIEGKEFKQFDKDEETVESENTSTEVIFGTEEWFAQHDDSEEISAGYTVGNYKADASLKQQVSVLCSEISAADPTDLEMRSQVLAKYSEALTVVNQIYGTTMKQEALSMLSNAYSEYQSKMQ